MNLKLTRLNILNKPEDLSGRAKTGVSLHCHTENSREMLDFVPFYAERMPIISHFWAKEKKKYVEREGEMFSFEGAFWSPPMTGKSVFDIESKQINDAGLNSIVSISDHDCIDANLQVNESTKNEVAPISMEWTVPFDFGFFHVGVHNLPKDRAVEITKDLLDYTFSKNDPANEKLHQLFALLNDLPEVLVILNHPLWDIEMVGAEKHAVLLKGFLKEFGRWLHAFEVNGFRAWSENKAVIEMAEALNYPIVTGGDRHGCQPNTVFNLTNAKTFGEFAEEIRQDKHSEIVMTPEYSQPLHSRQLFSFSEILSHYPDFPEHRRRWFDRVHVDIKDGQGVRPLSNHWKRGGPPWLRWAIWTLGALGSPKMMPVFKVLRKKKDRVPRDLNKTKFELPNVEEIRAANLQEAEISSIG